MQCSIIISVHYCNWYIICLNWKKKFYVTYAGLCGLAVYFVLTHGDLQQCE
jgi:hypothetical protein